MSEPTDVLLARLEERFRTMFENQERERNDRAKLENSIRNLKNSVAEISNRLKNVEESLAKNEPTIEEFITIKHKVVGAGIFGKWVWAAAGAILSMLVVARKEIFTWFAG